MPRAQVTVRDAGPGDLAAVVALAGSFRDVLTGPRRAGTSARATPQERYADALADPGRRLVLAVDGEDQALGMALLTPAPVTSLLDAPALHVTHLVVADRHRRRGAGRALLAAAAARAEELGLEQVVVSVAPGSREANRFYARLGFAPLVLLRAAPTASLRRRLSAATPVPVAPSRHRLGRRALGR